jgi:membrane protein
VYRPRPRSPNFPFLLAYDMSSRFPVSLIRIFWALAAAARRHRDAHAAQSAAALALALLFALVPLLVLAQQLADLLPDALRVARPLRAYLTGALLPDETGASVVRHAMRFVAKARRLSPADLLVLLVSAWVWVRTADHAINAMWSQAPRRRLRQTALVYLGLPLLAPLALGTGAALSLYLVTASLGLIDEPTWFKLAALRTAAALVTAGFLLLLYGTLPRARVSLRYAVTGALVASALLSLMQKALSVYIDHVPGYELVYGALATLPVFLLWLYLFWSIVLFGASLTAELHAGVRSGNRL